MFSMTCTRVKIKLQSLKGPFHFLTVYIHHHALNRTDDNHNFIGLTYIYIYNYILKFVYMLTLWIKKSILKITVISKDLLTFEC